MALDRPPLRVCAAVLRAGSMRQGAERRHAGRQCATPRPARYVRGPVSGADTSTNVSRPRARAWRRGNRPRRTARTQPRRPRPRPIGWRRWRRRCRTSVRPREDQTTLVGLKSSAFPYLGNNPRTDEPFLNISKGERRGHRSYGGRVYWQDETYNDNRVLMHVPENVRRPANPASSWCSSTATARRWNATCATANWCRSRFRIPASTPCCWRRSSRSTPPIPAPASSGSPAASSASSTSWPITSPGSTAIRARPGLSPTCRSSSSATAAASCRRPGASRSAASATACAACSCSTRSMANSTSSRPGS